MSTPIQCLVSWKERKKIISINGHTMEDVLAAVKATYFGDVASTGRIEVYNAQFEAYVDPPGNHVFCDGSKIRIITDEAMPHACSTNELLVVSPELEPSTTQPFHGSDYRLPPLPLDLKVAIGNTELGKVSSRTKSRIVSWLSHHLMNFTVYPGRRLYEAASKALVVEYPVLRDTIGTGWTTSIPYDDHDEGVLVGHLEFMSKEMSKRAPDLQKLSESMKQTRSSRRSWMKDTVPTTAEILEKYPALGNVEMLHEEFTAITSIQMEKKLLEFFNNFGPRILELLKTRHSTKDLVKELEKELEKLEGNSRKYRFAVALIELLPLLLKEKTKFLRGPDIYPALCFEGTSIREAEEMTVVFEAFNIHVVDVIAGMTAIMELYWVLDIMYSESNKNTLTLLEYFCGLPSVPRAPLLLRTISSIKS
ncbi:uncharacterized protein LOC142776636 [Rhipicephalus microplus]|uniref:uncharacterized protein LOC142776636 n=1 Tax=Rhipicephalus microplus TaxID=6941 RepID=UPI003F6BE369